MKTPFFNHNKKSLLICSISVICVLFSNIAKSQTVLLDVDQSKDTIDNKYGPNKNFYMQFTMGYFFVEGPSEIGAPVKSWSSAGNILSFRFKHKLGSVMALGWALNYHRSSFSLKQEAGKYFPDSTLHKSESYSFNGAGTEFYIRFNFDPGRGNYIGKYIDFGISGDAIFLAPHKAEDKISNGNIVDVRTTHLDYVNPFDYYGLIRLGKGNLLLSASYRFSNLFKPSFSYPEFPRWMVGLELTFD